MDLFIPLQQKSQREQPTFQRDFAGCAPVGGSSDPYDALLARLKREHVPYSVLWELTHKCNLKCVMCYNEPLNEPELSTAECLSILQQLAAAGSLRLTLSGGEILTRPDFFTIAGEARRLGFALDLKTNATLVTPAIADRLAALLPVQVDVSLLGARAETFDAVAGVERALERVLRGVRLLQERGLRIKLNTLLLDLNIKEREEMLDLAAQLGVQYEQVLKVSPTDKAVDKAGQHQLSVPEMTQAYLADHTPFAAMPQLPDSRTCGVGLSSCLISPYGEVFPCIELRIAAGNLRRAAFADIWRDAPIFQELRGRHVRLNLRHCSVCPISSYCEGRCSGLAWKEHGQPYDGHTLACWQAQARYAQLHPGEQVPETPYLRERRERTGRASVWTNSA